MALVEDCKKVRQRLWWRGRLIVSPIQANHEAKGPLRNGTVVCIDVVASIAMVPRQVREEVVTAKCDIHKIWRVTAQVTEARRPWIMRTTGTKSM